MAENNNYIYPRPMLCITAVYRDGDGTCPESITFESNHDTFEVDHAVTIIEALAAVGSGQTTLELQDGTVLCPGRVETLDFAHTTLTPAMADGLAAAQAYRAAKEASA